MAGKDKDLRHPVAAALGDFAAGLLLQQMDAVRAANAVAREVVEVQKKLHDPKPDRE
jgi:hypothetical protein